MTLFLCFFVCVGGWGSIVTSLQCTHSVQLYSIEISIQIGAEDDPNLNDGWEHFDTIIGYLQGLTLITLHCIV